MFGLKKKRYVKVVIRCQRNLFTDRLYYTVSTPNIHFVMNIINGALYVQEKHIMYLHGQCPIEQNCRLYHDPIQSTPSQNLHLLCVPPPHALLQFCQDSQWLHSLGHGLRKHFWTSILNPKRKTITKTILTPKPGYFCKWVQYLPNMFASWRSATLTVRDLN